MKLHHVIVGPVTNSSNVLYSSPSKDSFVIVKGLLTELGLDVNEFTFTKTPGDRLIFAIMRNEIKSDEGEDLLPFDLRIEIAKKYKYYEGLGEDVDEIFATFGQMFDQIKEFLLREVIPLPRYDNEGNYFSYKLDITRNGKPFPHFENLVRSYNFDSDCSCAESLDCNPIGY